MRKFRAVFKEKQSLSEQSHEKKVLGSFTGVYNALLEKYNISHLNSLDKNYREVFLAELNSYWDEKQGVLPMGRKFLKGNSDLLNESSTHLQKKNYLKKRAVPAINETLRQSGLKYKLYDIIDEMYKGVSAKNLKEIMSPKEMTEIMVESFRDSVRDFMTEIKYELTENSNTTPVKKKAKAILHRSKKSKNQKVNEGFFKRTPIKLEGAHKTPEAEKVARILLDLLKAENIKATVDGMGYVRDKDLTVLAGITPRGYVDIPGIGNWAPDEIEDTDKILDGMKMQHENPYF